MYKIFLVCLLAVLPSMAFAAGTVTGKVIKVRVDNPSGQAMIYFDTNVSISGANCRGGTYKNVLAIDTTTQGGKSALSVALSAHATKAEVEAVGKLNCSVYGNGVAETLDYIQVK